MYAVNDALYILQYLFSAEVETAAYGYVVRAKGILKTTDGWKKFNITPEELLIEDTDAIAIGVLCVIGTHLDEEVIKKLF